MENLVPLIIVGIFVLGLVVERLFPARPQQQVRGWALRGVLGFIGTMAVNGLLPAVVAAIAGARSPLHLAELGLLPAIAATVLVGQLIGYWTHRALHRVPALWRWHQLHHSAERVDVLGSAYFHPLDMAIQVAPAAVAIALLGVGPEAGAIGGLIVPLVAVFQHLNVRTPRWMGWLVQRPESHSIHHTRGVHAYNYANLPIFDVVFGTFKNPETFSEPVGFWNGASDRVGTLLLGRDVEAENTGAQQLAPELARRA